MMFLSSVIVAVMMLAAAVSAQNGVVIYGKPPVLAARPSVLIQASPDSIVAPNTQVTLSCRYLGNSSTVPASYIFLKGADSVVQQGSASAQYQFTASSATAGTYRCAVNLPNSPIPVYSQVLAISIGSPTQPPVTTPPPPCPVNQERRGCFEACSCADIAARGNCMLCVLMAPGFPLPCACKDGYFKDSATGQCRLKSECLAANDTTTAPCPVNQERNGCFERCSCDDIRQNGQCKICIKPAPGSVPPCSCVDGYFNDTATNQCRLKSECSNASPQKQCRDPNEVYTECGTACPLTCENMNQNNRICTLQCVQGCFCKDSYVRNAMGVCVPKDQCNVAQNQTCTKPNERFNQCGNMCELKCEDIGRPKACPMICRLQGACVCEANHYRNVKGDCVTEAQCKTEQQSACSLAFEVGNCKALMPMWYYEASTDSCKQFNYGGCGGNANRFKTFEECITSSCAFGGRRTCKDGSRPVQCFVNPCQVNKCAGVPEAKCFSDYCGGCNARFFVAGTGREVSKEECNQTREAPTRPTCAVMLCMTGTRCVEDAVNGASCQPSQCASMRCMSGTTCVEDASGKATCAPVPRSSCMNVRCANGPCVDTPTGPVCNGSVNAKPSCAVTLCGPGTRCVEDAINGASCQASQCATMRCTSSTTCMEDASGRASCVPRKPSCAVTLCMAGTRCVEDAINGASCQASQCAAMDCIVGTTCVEDANGKASCVPVSRSSCMNVRCANGPCVDTPTGPVCSGSAAAVNVAVNSGVQ